MVELVDTLVLEASAKNNSSVRVRVSLGSHTTKFLVRVLCDASMFMDSLILINTNPYSFADNGHDMIPLSQYENLELALCWNW